MLRVRFSGNGRRWLRTAVLFVAVVLLALAIASVTEPALITADAASGAGTLIRYIPIVAADMTCDATSPGLLGFAPSHFGDPIRLDVQGHYAYAVDWSGSLNIFDISDPCYPLRLGSAEWTDNEFQDVTVEGNYAYVANDANGLAKYDISNPNAPFRVAARKDGAGYATSIFYDGGRYALVGQIYSAGTELAIYDLGVFWGKWAGLLFTGDGWAHLWEVYGAGDRAHISAGDGQGNTRFQILDVSVLPAAPLLVHSLDLPLNTFGNGFAIAVQGDYAYLSSLEYPPYDGGLLVINLADETAPFVEGALSIPNAGNMPWKRPGLDVVGDTVYMVGGDGLYGLDVTDPAHPNQVFFYHFPDYFGSTAGGDVVVQGDLAITVVRRPEPWGSQDHGGLAIYRVAGN